MAALMLRAPRRHRRPNLTPMIDVVFLLLVFFMLASRFGTEQGLSLALPGGQSGALYQGPPRLVEVTPLGPRLNGLPLDLSALPDALAPLMTAPDDTIILRATGGADLQALVAVMSALRAAGLTTLVLVN